MAKKTTPVLRPNMKAQSDARQQMKIEQGLAPPDVTVDLPSPYHVRQPPVLDTTPAPAFDVAQLQTVQAVNPDAQNAEGVTADSAFQLATTANERTLEAQRRYRTPIASGGMGESGPLPQGKPVTSTSPASYVQMASAIDATRARLERLNGTRTDSWMYDAHIASKVQGTSDAPVTADLNGTYDEALKNRYDGIQNDIALDGLTRPRFDQIAQGNPVAAANGGMLGDTWRTVQALPAPTAEAGTTTGQKPNPKGQQKDTTSVGLPWGKQYPDVGTMIQDWSSGVAGAANELLGVKPAKGAEAQAQTPQMTPQQALDYLTGGKSAPPPVTKGPLDAAWQVAGDVAKTAVANTVDAVAQVAPGVYAGVKTALDGIDGISSAAAGAAGNATGIQFLKDYAQGGLGLPEADAVFGKPQTAAGAVSRNISTFLTGFYLGGKALQAVGWAAEAGGSIAQGSRFMAQGAIADAGFFDGQAGKLSDLLVQVPALKNPVTEFLATKPTDTEAEGRLKNALNGVIATPLIPAFIGTVRALRGGARWAGMLKSATTGAETVAGAPAAVTRTLLGDASAGAPLTVAVNPADAKLATAAAEVQAKGLTEIGGGPAGGPVVLTNFAAIKTPDDIQKIANDLVTAYEGTTDEARRGVVSAAQTRAAGGELDAFDSLMARRAGEAPNDAQVYAWKSLYMGSLTKLQEVAQKASQAPLNEAPQALLQMREMQSTVLAIQKEFYGARAEAGRALNAFKISGDTALQAKQVEAMLNQYGGIDANVDLARKIAGINDPTALADFIEASTFSKAKDAWQQLFYFNVLSSPKTHIRNFVGNSVMFGLNAAETFTAAQLSRVMGDDGVHVGEAMAQWYGIKAAFGDALQAAGRTFKTGESTGGYGLNKIDFPQRNAISADAWGQSQGSVFGRAVDVLGSITQSTNRALASSDEFFKTVGASATGYQYAFRQAQGELARGVITQDQVADRVTQLVTDFPNRLDSPARAAVADKAAYLTFTTPPKPGGFVDLLLKARALGDQPDASLGAKGFGIAARMVVPFVNTPSNILLATFERTPLAPLTARYRDAMAKGGADAYVANARMAVGSMTMATWLDLAMNGTVTGKGPSDPAQYAVLYATGWRPFSVKLDGHYVSYQGLEPLSTILGWSAQIGEVLANTDMGADPTAQANYEKATAAAIFAIGDVVLSKSYLSSASDLVDTIHSGTASAAENYIKKYGAGLVVPNAVRDVETIIDPVQRYATSVIEEMRARVPGLSGDLPPRRDAFGFVKNYQSGFGAAYDAVSPFYASQVKSLPVASAMLKDGWAISSPQMAFSINGQRVDVTNQPVIYSRFLELRGQVKPSDLPNRFTPNYAASDRYASGEAAQTWSDRLRDRYGDRNMTDALNGIVAEGPPPDLQDLATTYHSYTNADDRRRFILNIVGDYQDAAKAVLFSEYPNLLARAAQLKAAGQETQP